MTSVSPGSNGSNTMPHPDQAVVTGAFSYTGRYVAQRLLDEGVGVKTLTRSPDQRDPFGGLVQAVPLDFSDPDGLSGRAGSRGPLQHLLGAFRRGRTTFNQAAEHSKLLFEAAAKAGVGRIVHFSVANASSEPRLPYFRGKGLVEEILKDTGIPYAIIRPTLVFGEGDLLLNNMAWALRRFPVRFSPFSGAVIIQCNSFMLRTWRCRRWMPVR